MLTEERFLPSTVAKFYVNRGKAGSIYFQESMCLQKKIKRMDYLFKMQKPSRILFLKVLNAG